MSPNCLHLFVLMLIACSCISRAQLNSTNTTNQTSIDVEREKWLKFADEFAKNLLPQESTPETKKSTSQPGGSTYPPSKTTGREVSRTPESSGSKSSDGDSTKKIVGISAFCLVLLCACAWAKHESEHRQQLFKNLEGSIEEAIVKAKEAGREERDLEVQNSNAVKDTRSDEAKAAESSYQPPVLNQKNLSLIHI
eukprot:TRINITY_DN10078_c0_g1_i1.p1 TRINITY_DN10078_c0_g1~~TRINITY_DN10078_c0_g1_i1.p1  ORF type:complete len:195 (-),score=42.25 TRINITY_DN10078_c0_g1_i1:60-644(-)